MMNILRASALCALVSACTLSVAGCGTTPAPDFRGDWRAANSAPEMPQAIALRPQRLFTVVPVDGTLKTTLERWARDAGVELRYDAAYDFTLHAAAGDVSDADLASALRMLGKAYSAQNVDIVVEDGAIVVRGGKAISGDASGL